MNGAKDAVLWICTEDYAGLWEIVWDLRGHGRAAMGDEALIELARQTTTDLLDRGLIVPFTCIEPFGDLSPLGVGEARGRLSESASWILPEDGGLGIRMGITPAGEAAYNAEGPQPLAEPGR